MPKFLHAVCGTVDKSRTTRLFAGADWQEVRMDPDAASAASISGGLLDIAGLEEESFDAVFTSHSLECLYPHEAVAALAAVRRVVRRAGHLVVTCADIQAACALVAEGKLLEPAYTSAAGPVAPIDILYGFRPALASGRHNMARRCGFTAQTLIGALAQAGFGSVWSARNPRIFTLAAIATREECSEDRLKELAHKHFG